MRRLMLTQSNALQLWGGWKQRPTLPLPLGGMAISISTRASRNIWSIDRVPWLVYGKLLKANSHRNAGRDKTVLSVSRPLRWWCELDSRQLETVGDRKFEVRTRSEQSSSDRHTRHDTDTTVLACLAVGVNWALGIIDWNAAPFAWRAHTGHCQRF